MSRTTFQNAISELHGLLANTTTNVPVASLDAAGVQVVYPYEPGAAGWIKPCSVTLSPSGIDPTDWRIDVRVYVDGGQSMSAAQDLLIDVTVAVGDLLKAGAGYGPDRWQMGWTPELECFVALSTVEVGREDGF